MRPSPEPHANATKTPAFADDVPDSELPDAPDFISRPPRVDPDEMLRLSEEYLPHVTSHPDFYKRWREDKVTVPFELK